jgi:hypothetical protein
VAGPTAAGPGVVDVSGYKDARTGDTYAVTPDGGKLSNVGALVSEIYALQQNGQSYELGLGGLLELNLAASPNGDTYIWIGGRSGKFTDAAHWIDTATRQVATTAPGIHDAAWFTGGAVEVSGAASVTSLVVDNGAQVMLTGTDQDQDHLGAIDVQRTGRLAVVGAVVDASSATVGAGSVLDISRAAEPQPTADQPDLGEFGGLTCKAPRHPVRPAANS